MLNIDKHSFYNGEEAIRHQTASALYVFMKRHDLMDNCENIMSYVIKNIRYECISNDDPVLRNKVNIYHSLQIPLLDIAKSFRADVHLTNMEYD